MRISAIVCVAVGIAGIGVHVGCSKAKKTEAENSAPAPASAPVPTPAAPSPAAAPAPAPAAAPAAAAAAPGAVVGNPAPNFTLNDLDGKPVSLAAFRGKTVVLEWFNPECPFVKRSHSKGSLVALARKQMDAGVVWLAINSAAPGKQGHDPVVMSAAAKEWNLGHPILRDESGTVGRAYGATNTPHMFVIAPDGKVVYGGAIDNSPDGQGQSPAGGTLVNHVEAALSDLAAGRPVATAVTKAYGCGVKYGS